MPKGPFYGDKWVDNESRHICVHDLIGFIFAFRHPKMKKMILQFEGNNKSLMDFLANYG